MTECPSCHTVPPTPHSDYCKIVDHASQLTHAELYPNHTQQILTKREPWLGHRDACSLQWSDDCDCPNGEYHLGWNAALREVLEVSKIRGYQAAVEWAKSQRSGGGVPHG